MFLWTAWALRRTKFLWVGIAIGPALVMSLTNLTCYYYSYFMVAAGLVLLRPQLGPALLVTSGASQLLLDNYYWVDDKYNAQSWLFYALALLVLFAYSRPFSIARLKAWWELKPEPKGYIKGLEPTYGSGASPNCPRSRRRALAPSPGDVRREVRALASATSHVDGAPATGLAGLSAGRARHLDELVIRCDP